MGTRLRSVVADRPKVLALVHGRPFLAFLLDQLVDFGFTGNDVSDITFKPIVTLGSPPIAAAP